MKAAAKILAVIAFTAFWGIVGREVAHLYRDLNSHASSAEYHLRTAESELQSAAQNKDFSRLARARGEFAAARADFAAITGRIESLGPIYDVAGAVPWLGEQARAAKKLMLAGGYVSQAGEEACLAAEGLIDAGKKGDGKKNTELMMAAVPAAAAHVAAALEAVERAQDEYQSVPGDGLHPLLRRALDELKSQVPRQRLLLQSGVDVLKVLPDALGGNGERIYLILVQDAAELRPTGGFLGNYGIIRIRNGQMTQVFFNDVYRVDWPYYWAGKSGPPVGMFARYFPESTFWALRDSNVWPDFERAARQAAWFAVDEGVAERVDGVIAITDDIVQPLMSVVGPITIEEFGETVSESNVLERIRYYQTIGPSPELLKKLGERAEGNRKYFTSLVLGAIIDRLNNLDIGGLMSLALSLQDSVKSKGVQASFVQPELQKLVEAYDLGGQMKAATGDYLWVVDMNVSASKDNLYVKPSISYSVAVSTTGGAISQLELAYDYTQRQGERWTGTVGRPFYGNYLRVYVPPGSKLLGEEGTDEPVETLSEGGKTVFGNYVRVYPGTLRKVTLRYWVPLKTWQDGGRTGYELLVQKQAGNDVDFQVAVSLPPGASVVDRGAFESAGGTLRYRGPLDSDTRLAATFDVRQ